jgi:hypothetical protein
MPTPRQERADRMLLAVDALERLDDNETPTDAQTTEFWLALQSFLPTFVGGMTSMNIDAHGNVTLTFLKNQKK